MIVNPVTTQTTIVLDLETTGLFPAEPNAAILEIAMIAVKVPFFRELATWHTPVRRPFDDQLKGADEIVRKMHEDSGLAAELAAGAGVPLGTAEAQALQFYNRCCSGSRVYLMGANPDFDRRWLEHHMPNLAKKFHYRNLDVNSLFILKEYLQGKEKTGTRHRALDDCRQAIAGVHAHFDLMRSLFGGSAPGAA
jgi:oligoribonuclease (3'-5' exoribonuclease)